MTNKLKPRTELLKLIDDLKVSLTPEEAREHVEKLSEREVKILTAKYQKVKTALKDIENSSKFISPKGFDKIKEDYNKKVATIEDDYIDKLEKIQEDMDGKLEAIDLKTEAEFEKIVKEHDKEVDTMEKQYNEFYEKTESLLTPKTPN